MFTSTPLDEFNLFYKSWSKAAKELDEANWREKVCIDRPEDYEPKEQVVEKYDEQPTEDDRRITEEVMDARKWIEYGKMWNVMSNAGFNLNLLSVREFDDVWQTRPAGLVYVVESLYTSDRQEAVSIVAPTPYAALKDLYFKLYLEIEEFEDTQINFTEGTLEELYETADKEGITVDELVIKALKAALGME